MKNPTGNMNNSPTRKGSELRNAGGGEMTIGRQFQTNGKLTDRDIKKILVTQHERGLLFGEAAIALGLLTEEDVQKALAAQFAYPYVDISGSPLSDKLVVAHRPFGEPAEAFRTLRSQLVLRAFNGEGPRALAVFSPRAGQGASCVAANLALAFAQLGERTLLIDANFRNPAQNHLFGLKSGAGLSSLLSGRTSPTDVLQRVEPFTLLSVLCAGTVPPNPQEMLSRVAFTYLIETAPSTFDITIIDCPPLLEYSDSQVIAAEAKACLLVTRRNETRIADVELAKQHLGPTGALLTGAIVLD